MPGMKADRSRAARRDPDVGRSERGERAVQLLAGLQERVRDRLQQRRDIGDRTSEPDLRSTFVIGSQIRWKFFSTSRRVMRSTTGRPCGQTLE